MTTTKRRTDAHAPGSSEFKTENYQYVGSFDSSPSAYMVVEVGQFGQKTVSYTPDWERAKQMMAMVAASSESRNDGRCDHCGATIRYRAVMRHTPTGQVIQVGEQCLDNRFSVATADFKAMKKAAEEARAQQRVRKAVEAFVEQNPDLAWMAQKEPPAEYASSYFLTDVARKFRAYGELSERQVAAVRKQMPKEVEFQARKRAQEAERSAAEAARPHAPAPRGRVTVTGEVWKVQEPDEYAQFPTWRMLVADDRGFRVWGSVPSALFGKYGSAPRRGDRVSFSAEVTPSDKDPEFGFYKRPTQARVVEEATPAGPSPREVEVERNEAAWYGETPRY